MKRIRIRPMWVVVGLLSILVLGGGTATAARLITGKQIKNGSIASADIKDGSIASGDIRNGAVTARDLAPGATQNIASSITVPPGPAGPQGPAGPAGPQGPAGPAGASGVTQIVSSQHTDFTEGAAVALCPRGTRPVSGGGIDMTPAGAIIADGAYLADDGRLGWAVVSSDYGEVTTLVYCSAGISSFQHPNGPARRAGGDAVISGSDLDRLKAKRQK